MSRQSSVTSRFARAPESSPRKPCRRSGTGRKRQLLVEELEDRRLLFFHNTGLGGLLCELKGEEGRLVYQLAAQRTADLSPAGEELPAVFRSAVREALGDSIGDTVDRVRVHWNSTLTDSLGPIDLGSAIAQTYGHDVYIEDARGIDIFDAERTDLILHELKHVLQFEQYSSSLSNFGYHYFKEHCQAGFSYQGNSLEEDARDFARLSLAAVWAKLWPGNRKGVRNR